jgi:hypothetical protein
MQDVKIPFALHAGRVVHISEVERGRACMCNCPNCQRPLQAIKGRVRQHHFRHDHEQEQCEGALESAIHLAAKQLISERKFLNLPRHSLSVRLDGKWGDDYYVEGEEVIPHGTLIKFIDVETEVAMGDIRPDLVGYAGNSSLAIEITYTHPVSPEKVEKFKALNQSAIEIKLSDAGENDLLDWDKFWGLISNPDNVRWVYNAKDAKEETRIETGLIKRRERDELKTRAVLSHYQKAITPENLERIRTSGPQHPAWRYSSRYFPYPWESLPSWVDVPVKNGDWIYGCDHRVWQVAVFSYFITKRGVGTKFTTKAVDSWLIKTVKCQPPSFLRELLFHMKHYPVFIPEEVSSNVASSWQTLHEYLAALSIMGILTIRGREYGEPGSCWYEVLDTSAASNISRDS